MSRPSGGQRGRKRKCNDEPGIRERILEEAMRLFASKGFEGTSIRHITQAAQVTNPMIYYYFGSKEELFLTLLLETFEVVASRQEGLLVQEGVPLRDRLIGILESHFEAVQEKPDMARLFFHTQFGPQRDSLRERLEGHFSKWKQATRALFLESQLTHEGQIDLVMLHWRGVMTAPILAFLDGEPVELSRDTAEFLVDRFLRGAGVQVTR